MLIALLVAGYLAYGIVPPRYLYTVHETRLIVDGEEVTVTGLLECVRKGAFFIPSGGASEPYEIVGTSAAAVKLGNGGAVLTMFPDVCNSIGTRSGSAYLPGFYPAIYLIDSATEPERIEYHFSDVSLRDPNLRVRLVDFSTRRSWSPIRSYRLLARYHWRNLSSAVPGLMGESAMYVGYAMTKLSFSELSAAERAFVDSQLGAANALLKIRSNSPETRPGFVSLLERTGTHVPDASTGLICQFQETANQVAGCDKLHRTFGLPVIDGTATLQSVAELRPYIELVRRRDLAGEDDNGYRRFRSIENVTKFLLFDSVVTLAREEFLRTILLAPKQQLVFGLEVELLSRDRILDQ